MCNNCEGGQIKVIEIRGSQIKESYEPCPDCYVVLEDDY